MSYITDQSACDDLSCVVIGIVNDGIYEFESDGSCNKCNKDLCGHSELLLLLLLTKLGSI
jgi:hypothetical protein